jgi:hypothetical protein
MPRSITTNILGHARSGTTIWMNYLNLSDNVRILGESWSYTEYRWEHWRQRFNYMHKGKVADKGHYVGPQAGEKLHEVWEYFQSNYEYFGEKLAIRITDDASWPALAEKVAKEILFSEERDRIWILTFRDPRDILVSNLKMFISEKQSEIDASNFEEYVKSLLIVTWIQLHIFFREPNSIFVFSENAHRYSEEDLIKELGLSLKPLNRVEALFVKKNKRQSRDGKISREMNVQIQALKSHEEVFLSEGFKLIQEIYRELNREKSAVCRERSQILYHMFRDLQRLLQSSGFLDQNKIIWQDSTDLEFLNELS